MSNNEVGTFLRTRREAVTPPRWASQAASTVQALARVNVTWVTPLGEEVASTW